MALPEAISKLQDLFEGSEVLLKIIEKIRSWMVPTMCFDCAGFCFDRKVYNRPPVGYVCPRPKRRVWLMDLVKSESLWRIDQVLFLFLDGCVTNSVISLQVGRLGTDLALSWESVVENEELLPRLAQNFQNLQGAKTGYVVF